MNRGDKTRNSRTISNAPKKVVSVYLLSNLSSALETFPKTFVFRIRFSIVTIRRIL